MKAVTTTLEEFGLDKKAKQFKREAEDKTAKELLELAKKYVEVNLEN